jgi:hypothetical protein
VPYNAKSFKRYENRFSAGRVLKKKKNNNEEGHVTSKRGKAGSSKDE